MRVLVTGGRGMMASNIRTAAEMFGTQDQFSFVTRDDADLTDFVATKALFARMKPDVVVHAAAKVGGIAANIAQPAEFLMDNVLIDSNVLRSSVDVGVESLIYFGSSCMYPKDYRQPLVETDILAAPLEPTNEGYALSKITAAKYCDYASQQYGLQYKVLIPSNLYGPGDDYTPGQSHLVASTLAKVYAAKQNKDTSVEVWGDGSARREFTYVGDIASWLVRNIDNAQNWPAAMNVGYGTDHSITEYYEAAMQAVDYHCDLIYDTTKPVGMHQKLMDSSVAKAFNWNPTTDLATGMAEALSQYVARLSNN